MSEVRSLHRQAMAALDQADEAERAGDLTLSEILSRQAFQAEQSAAFLLENADNAEPSRSVLFRSAASIALRCGLLHDAERLIYRALLGVPPKVIADQLRDLLEDVLFRRHLAVHGVSLDNDELQVSLSGIGVGFGIAPVASVLSRLSAANILLYRTAERLMQKPYRDAGPPTNAIRDAAQSFISVPRAASFAFSIRVGSGDQKSFDGLGRTEQIVDTFLDCMEVFDQGDKILLVEKIPDESYRNNFLGLAADIVPDGEIVTTVGLTALRPGNNRELALRNSARSIQERMSFGPTLLATPKKSLDSDAEETVREFAGVLRYADSTHEKDVIKLVGEKEYDVVVPTGMMNDIVRPRWNTYISIRAVRRRSEWILENIYKGNS